MLSPEFVSQTFIFQVLPQNYFWRGGIIPQIFSPLQKHLLIVETFGHQ